jgi:hypothetical protein
VGARALRRRRARLQGKRPPRRLVHAAWVSRTFDGGRRRRAR